jgi:hypothetical protein
MGNGLGKLLRPEAVRISSSSHLFIPSLDAVRSVTPQTRSDDMAKDKVTANQKKILSNQKRIEQNQDKLDTLIKNQRAILANQKKILANQKKIMGK